MQETTDKVIKEEGKMNLFTNNRLLYEGRDSGLSEEKIRRSLGVGGNKINSFIQFYLMFDGVLFPKQAMMFRHAFYSIKKGDRNRILFKA